MTMKLEVFQTPSGRWNIRAVRRKPTNRGMFLHGFSTREEAAVALTRKLLAEIEYEDKCKAKNRRRDQREQDQMAKVSFPANGNSDRRRVIRKGEFPGQHLH